MPNTHPSLLHKITCSAFVVTGIFLLASSTLGFFEGVVTSQGSTVVDHVVMDATLDQYHGAAFIAEKSAGSATQIVFGMVLILVGFGLHVALLKRSDRRVPVHAVQPGKRVQKTMKGTKKQKDFAINYIAYLWTGKF